MSSKNDWVIFTPEQKASLQNAAGGSNRPAAAIPTAAE
jgi:hypothetical protein